MRLRLFFLPVLLLWLWGSLLAGPNILIILSDQESERVPRFLLDLPNRTALEQRGIRFTQAFCTTPQCSPSRATILTGLYPHEAGVVANVDRSSLGTPLSPDLPSLGKVFREQGYATGYLGKWHLGNDAEGLERFGFSGYRQLRDPELAAAAADWIRSHTSRPWLLVVSFANPHDIYQITRRAPEVRRRAGVALPENFEDDLLSKPSPQRAFLTEDQGRPTLNWGEEQWLRYRSYYLELIEKVDAHVGVVMEAVQSTGQAEKSIVIYTSDHGDMNGAHRLPFKGPFMYDELLTVPLVISYPPRFKKPVRTDAPVSLVDLVPTLCTLAQVKWPARLSGKDLTPLFEDPAREINPAVFAEYYAKQRWVNPIRTIRTREWKYNRYLNGGEELYHLRADPGELHNRSGDASCEEIRRKLAEQLSNF